MNRIVAIAIAVILVTGGLTVALRGQVQTKDAFIVEGIPLVDRLASIGPSSYSLAFIENFTDSSSWGVAFTSNVNGSLLVKNNSATVDSYFSGGDAFQALQVRHSIGVNVSASPLLALQFTTSQNSLGFGVRFEGIDVQGNNVTIQSPSSSVEHQKISGQPQVIQVDVESYANSLGFNLSRVTKIIFYLESGPQSIGTVVLQISSLSFSRVEPTSYSSSSSGAFQYMLIVLNDPKLNMKLDRVELAFDVSGSPDLRYVPELVQKFNELTYYQYSLSQGLEYVVKSSSAYEIATVASSKARPIDNLAYPMPTNLTISLHALTGTITSFTLKDLSLFYSAQPTVSGQLIPSSSVLPCFISYLGLVFVLPLAIFLLIYRLFYRTSIITKRLVLLIAGVGLLLRGAIAPFTGGFDLSFWIFYSRVYFESGTVNLSYYPVLPPVYVMFLLTLSPYFLLRYFGLSDQQFFVHANYMVESLFAKLPMMLADIGIFLVLFRLFSGNHRTGKNLVYASAFLFNPFSVYISAAWGQTDSLMLLGMLTGILLTEQEKKLQTGATLALSALVKLFSLYATLLLTISHLMRREFRRVGVIVATFAAVFLLGILPLANLNNLWASLFLRLVASSGASVSQTSLLRILLPGTSSISSSLLILVPFSALSLHFAFWKSNNKLLATLVMIAISIYVLELGAEPQWFLWLIPLMILLGQRDGREGLTFLALTFGAVFFLITSIHLQGLGLMVTGEQYWFTPLEVVPNGFTIFAVVSVSMFATVLAFMFFPRRYFRSKIGTLVLSSELIALVYLVAVIAIR